MNTEMKVFLAILAVTCFIAVAIAMYFRTWLTKRVKEYKAGTRNIQSIYVVIIGFWVIINLLPFCLYSIALAYRLELTIMGSILGIVVTLLFVVIFLCLVEHYEPSDYYDTNY